MTSYRVKTSWQGSYHALDARQAHDELSGGGGRPANPSESDRSTPPATIYGTVEVLFLSFRFLLLLFRFKNTLNKLKPH